MYLSEKTDVAFRPFGLDIFDKLSKTCEEVRSELERERNSLEMPSSLPSLSEDTAAYDLVSHITSLTKPEDVRALATLSEEEKERRQQLRDQIRDLESDDPQKTARALTLRAQRLDTLAAHAKNVAEILSDDAVASVFVARDAVESAREAIGELRRTTFSPELLAGTGSDLWRAMWEAARRFSSEEAYPTGEFPVTEDDAKCLLCQQQLRGTSPDRLKRFEEFIKSTLQKQLDQARSHYANLRQGIETLAFQRDTTDFSLEELRIDSEQLGTLVDTGFRQAKERHTQVLRALTNGDPLPEGLPILTLDADAVAEQSTALRQRATEVLRSTDQETKERLSKELRELEDRSTLCEKLGVVLEEIERKKRLAAFELCRKDTNTRGITLKSSEVTRAVVTQRLASSFQRELKKLWFMHLEVELQEAGGTRGTLYHKLILKRASRVELPRVVSEGEARTLSIAAFFAELSTSLGRSSILFDDPVSSLDHNWRESVARRLVEEAEHRQVIVFTHDIAFLVTLVTSAEESERQCQHQYLRRENWGAGTSSPDLPWIAMKVRDRLGVLRNEWQVAEKLFRTAPRDQYEREAKFIYGLLREAWERGLEEVMLGGTVERYRRSIQTRRARQLYDITEADCTALEAGMTKSSRWLVGHDQVPVENVPVPEPDELKKDIEALDEWVRTIDDRRR